MSIKTTRIYRLLHKLRTQQIIRQGLIKFQIRGVLGFWGYWLIETSKFLKILKN